MSVRVAASAALIDRLDAARGILWGCGISAGLWINIILYLTI